MKFSKFLIGLTLAAASALFAVSCGEDEPEKGQTSEGIKVEMTLPASVELTKGEACTLSMNSGSVVYTSDVVQLQDSNGKLIDCTISSVTSDSFTFVLPDSFVEGTYRIYIKRGSERKLLGSLIIKIVTDKWEIENGTTVYGTVTSAEGPVPGVVISDGVDFAVSNELGRYELKSKKALGYVFMSVPSGYEPKTSGILPINYFALNAAGTVPENVNF